MLNRFQYEESFSFSYNDGFSKVSFKSNRTLKINFFANGTKQVQYSFRYSYTVVRCPAKSSTLLLPASSYSTNRAGGDPLQPRQGVEEDRDRSGLIMQSRGDELVLFDRGSATHNVFYTSSADGAVLKERCSFQAQMKWTQSNTEVSDIHQIAGLEPVPMEIDTLNGFFLGEGFLTFTWSGSTASRSFGVSQNWNQIQMLIGFKAVITKGSIVLRHNASESKRLKYLCTNLDHLHDYVQPLIDQFVLIGPKSAEYPLWKELVKTAFLRKKLGGSWKNHPDLKAHMDKTYRLFTSVKESPSLYMADPRLPITGGLVSGFFCGDGYVRVMAYTVEKKGKTVYRGKIEYGFAQKRSNRRVLYAIQAYFKQKYNLNKFGNIGPVENPEFAMSRLTVSDLTSRRILALHLREFPCFRRSLHTKLDFIDLYDQICTRSANKKKDFPAHNKIQHERRPYLKSPSRLIPAAVLLILQRIKAGKFSLAEAERLQSLIRTGNYPVTFRQLTAGAVLYNVPDFLFFKMKALLDEQNTKEVAPVKGKFIGSRGKTRDCNQLCVNWRQANEINKKITNRELILYCDFQGARFENITDEYLIGFQHRNLLFRLPQDGSKLQLHMYVPWTQRNIQLRLNDRQGNKASLHFFNETSNKLHFQLNGWNAFNKVFQPFVEKYPLYGLFGESVNQQRRKYKVRKPEDLEKLGENAKTMSVLEGGSITEKLSRIIALPLLSPAFFCGVFDAVGYFRSQEKVGVDGNTKWKFVIPQVSAKKDITFLAIIEKTLAFHRKTDRDLTMLRNKMHTGLTRSLSLSYGNLPKQLALYSLFTLYGSHYILYRNLFKRGKHPATLGVEFLDSKKRREKDLLLSAPLRRRAIKSACAADKIGKQPTNSILGEAVETVKAYRDLLLSLLVILIN